MQSQANTWRVLTVQLWMPCQPFGEQQTVPCPGAALPGGAQHRVKDCGCKTQGMLSNSDSFEALADGLNDSVAVLPKLDWAAMPQGVHALLQPALPRVPLCGYSLLSAAGEVKCKVCQVQSTCSPQGRDTSSAAPLPVD